MATIQGLDADITALQSRLSTLHAHRANLTSILLSQPHLSSRLRPSNNSTHHPSPTQRIIAKQSTRNAQNIYRACAGVTAYRVKDPDPHAINNGNILGVSIDVSISGTFIETYHVLLNFSASGGKRVLRVHKHTIPPCVALQQLANKWLPVSAKDSEDAEAAEQDLVRFGRALRKELVGWHLRMKAMEGLREEAGFSGAERREQSGKSQGQVLNAFASDDEDGSSDVEEGDDAGLARILDIEADMGVRQITVTWSDRRTASINVTKDGRIEKAVCRSKDGSRDIAMSRKAIGPLSGLIRRLKA